MRSEELRERILSFILSGNGSFDELATELFAYQFEHNPSYNRYCKHLGITPKTIKDWHHIPPVPTLAFKFFDLTCQPVEKARFIFISSGTTHGQYMRSRHYIFDERFYEAAASVWFKQHLLPDDAHMAFLILFPSHDELKNSSLAFMLDLLKSRFGSHGSANFVTNGRLLVSELIERLINACNSGEPVCILGTSLAMCELIEECERRRLHFELPHGSRIMDTGGFKGRRKEIPKTELYERYESVLGIPKWNIINEYGMAELSSQFYDGVVGIVSERTFKPPPWVRSIVVDPVTLNEVEDGFVGILRHYDLANFDSVMAIQTDDIAKKCADGFILLGRAGGSEARGCSLLAEEWSAVRGTA
ncbi:MAG: long-chain fatty acid--CoA ligase [Armatimonadota bacterium]|nr:long-chain fatty acid--CoA ligase [Armatimonadota bacterium]MCX7777758.1 long-chain fatty acid--CoA ligase [Armatimonadota bacterium]MDW8026188.1 long-chain fatty acid--CoA ligase [Armatimonadota bacterium]